MGRPRAPGLLVALLTLCVTAGTPEVWVQVQMEATRPLSFSLRCGFLGPGNISLVTVSCGGPDGAGGTRLAVLHPEFGTERWPPARQARWETRTSVSLALEGSEERGLGPNTTFCCKFTSFPEGSQEACGSLLLLGTDPGFPAPTSTSLLRADLAGIWGISGVLLFACVYLLHLLRRQRHWSIPKRQPPLRHPLTQTQAAAAGHASLASPRVPYATICTNPLCRAALDTVLLPQPPARREPTPGPSAQHPAPRAPLPASARGSFVSVENGLYVQAGGRPPRICPNLSPPPDPLRPGAMEGRLGI